MLSNRERVHSDFITSDVSRQNSNIEDDLENKKKGIILNGEEKSFFKVLNADAYTIRISCLSDTQEKERIEELKKSGEYQKVLDEQLKKVVEAQEQEIKAINKKKTMETKKLANKLTKLAKPSRGRAKNKNMVTDIGDIDMDDDDLIEVKLGKSCNISVEKAIENAVNSSKKDSSSSVALSSTVPMLSLPLVQPMLLSSGGLSNGCGQM